MSYYVGYGRRPALGYSIGTTALVATGANLIVPGSGPIVAVGAGLLSSLFGGDQDASRQAREQWFEQGGRQGSIWADRVMLGALQNTASHEIPYYQDGINRLLSDPRTAPTMVTAKSIGPYWDSSDNATSDKMRALVETELIQLGQTAPSSSSFPSTVTYPTVTPAPSSAGVRLPAMVTTAPVNWMAWALGAAGLGLGLLVLPNILRPSRRS